MDLGRRVADPATTRETTPRNQAFETPAKKSFRKQTKGGACHARLAEKLAAIGDDENERNLNNKIAQGGFSAAFLLQCLKAKSSFTLSLQV